MVNKSLLVFLVIAFVFFYACKKEIHSDSVVKETSIPETELYAEPSYVFGVGSGKVFSTIPDTIALAIDSINGFEGGFGGKTGSDSIYILKTDMVGGWPDTTASGGSSISFSKANLIGYKANQTINIVLAEPIANPGPTDISGTYIRPSNGVTFDISKVFNGVYVIDNPGGAGVAPNPYLLYNYKSSTGADSLAFPTQTNPCGGGLKLVNPSAPLSLTSLEYDKSYPPAIISTNPLTLSWIVLEFPDTGDNSANPGAALCQWGTAPRTFVKE